MNLAHLLSLRSVKDGHGGLSCLSHSLAPRYFLCLHPVSSSGLLRQRAHGLIFLNYPGPHSRVLGTQELFRQGRQSMTLTPKAYAAEHL